MARCLNDDLHCEACINRYCKEGCSMISCIQSCNAIFHRCKQAEHELLCSNATVPCINQGNGCPRQMMRRELGKHLSKCPASVVCCTSEWNRSPAHNKESLVRLLDQPGVETNHLDLALARRDQQRICAAMKIPLTTPSLHGENLKQLFPIKGAFFPNSNLPFVQFRDDISGARVLDSPVSGDTPQTNDKEQSGTSESVTQSDTCNERNPTNTACTNQSHVTACDVGGDNCNISGISQIPVLELDMMIDSINNFRVSQQSAYTFICGDIFRRDEYAWHALNIHADIYSGLNGWLEQRCPLACYGCTYNIRRMHPNNASLRIVYSPLIESFGLQSYVQNINGQHDMLTIGSSPCNGNCVDCNHSDNGRGVFELGFDSKAIGPNESDCRKSTRYSLLDLPMEVLEHVILFLDGFSINNLALSCTLLRDLCVNMLYEKGVVLQQWSSHYVDGRRTWLSSENFWMFTKSMTAVSTWRLSDEIFKMTEHLESCAFNTKIVRTEKYRVMPDPEEMDDYGFGQCNE